MAAASSSSPTSTAAPQDECNQMQQDEILALDSIYNDPSLGSDTAAAAASTSTAKGEAHASQDTRARLVIERNQPGSPPILCLVLPGLEDGVAQLHLNLQVHQKNSSSAPTNGLNGLPPKPSGQARPPSAITPILPARPPTIRKLPPLAHLPPVVLRVRLPATYPLQTAPELLSLEAAWLSKGVGGGGSPSLWIQRRLQEQYDELGGSEVLWAWAQWLAEGMWEELLLAPGSTSPADLPFSAHHDGAQAADACELAFDEYLASPDDTPLLAATLLSHSRLCTRDDFDTSSFDCGICLENRKGRKCTRLEGCGHVFCSECLVAYLSMLVDEGFHRQAKRCPDPECVKMRGEMEKRGEDPEADAAMASSSSSSSTPGARRADDDGDNNDAAPSASATPPRAATVRGSISRPELATILTPEQLHRLDRLTTKARLESDPSITYCPRSDCQSAVVRKPGDEGIWERFRQCQECGMSFCAWCGRSWHGTNPCPVSFHADLVQKYRGLADGSDEKRQMELSFGKATLLKLVEKWEEEEKTRQWMKDFTTPCPTCSICIEKSYGMTCQSCRTHYCYLCGKSISATNPYLHFNTPGAGCYNRLFDGLMPGAPQVDEDGRPIDMADLIPWEEIL
ncbi:related to ring finger protein 14 [Pseudozyma flocculosa]|uniref:RBR-type E3 ubiquitin transferase n=1 Tax=Pseudozyma flocculosa TaxID=84751 RepID=A0A5C3F473_9BASI|nr:related to ring finger protein 14 [Pseudozyma flocculosa]